LLLGDVLQDRIDSGRRELVRLQDQIKSIEQSLKDEQSDAVRVNKNRQLSVVLDQLELLNKELVELSGQQQSKRHCSSFTVTVAGEDVSEVVLWKSEVIHKNVPREIVNIDKLLLPARPLISELRWLQLKLYASRDPSCPSLKEIVEMRKTRPPDSHDLEVPYHPILLLFYQFASYGQHGLEFLSEDHTLPKPREDIRGFINKKRTEPQECKSDCVYNPTNDLNSSKSIDANAEPLGKLLQVLYSL
jgi:hypothetical protein